MSATRRSSAAHNTATTSTPIQSLSRTPSMRWATAARRATTFRRGSGGGGIRIPRESHLQQQQRIRRVPRAGSHLWRLLRSVVTILHYWVRSARKYVRITLRERDKIEGTYVCFPDLRDVRSIHTVLRVHMGQNCGEEELTSIIRDYTLWRPGGIFRFHQLLRVMAELKRRCHLRRVPDTTEAFVALGGDCNKSDSVISTADLRARISDFELEVDGLLQGADGGNISLQEFRTFLQDDTRRKLNEGFSAEEKALLSTTAAAAKMSATQSQNPVVVVSAASQDDIELGMSTVQQDVTAAVAGASSRNVTPPNSAGAGGSTALDDVASSGSFDFRSVAGTVSYSSQYGGHGGPHGGAANQSAVSSHFLKSTQHLTERVSAVTAPKSLRHHAHSLGRSPTDGANPVVRSYVERLEPKAAELRSKIFNVKRPWTTEAVVERIEYIERNQMQMHRTNIHSRSVTFVGSRRLPPATIIPEKISAASPIERVLPLQMKSNAFSPRMHMATQKKQLAMKERVQQEQRAKRSALRATQRMGSISFGSPTRAASRLRSAFAFNNTTSSAGGDSPPQPHVVVTSASPSPTKTSGSKKFSAPSTPVPRPASAPPPKKSPVIRRCVPSPFRYQRQQQQAYGQDSNHTDEYDFVSPIRSSNVHGSPTPMATLMMTMNAYSTSPSRPRPSTACTPLPEPSQEACGVDSHVSAAARFSLEMMRRDERQRRRQEEFRREQELHQQQKRGGLSVERSR
eukprot:PhM_4_TR16664/c0_g2_i1/m.23951